jgi:chromosome segregation ATPase
VESFDEVSRVYETMLDLPFQDEAQKAVFFNFAEDIWEYTQDIYSHNIDARKAPLRQRLLEINTECAELQKAQNSNEKNRKKLNEIRHDIRTTLALLSSDSELEENALESLELRIGDIEDSLEDFA